jgi:hypothetical protein
MISTDLGDVVPVGLISTHATAAAATAVVITLPAVENRRSVLHGVQWSYSAAPTGGKLTITTNAVTIFEEDITASGPGGHTIVLPSLNNTTMVITLASGAGAVVGKLNVQHVNLSS